ncbi:MAG: GAF domain-containing SpoIIE family protein phosphatase [Armatimonadota bacterium]
MKKSAIIILIGAVGVLIACAVNLHAIIQPHPFAAVSWLAAILSFGVFAVMLMQHSIYGRPIHLYIGAAYLALGVMGIRESIVFPSNISVSGSENGYLALWQFGWITLALILAWGLIINRAPGYGQQRSSTIIAITAGSVLWAGSIVLLTSAFPQAMHSIVSGKPGMVISVICCIIFAFSAFMYSRLSVHKNNNVLAWMSYGLIFAMFAQSPVIIKAGSMYGTLFDIANLLKVLTFLSPLAGMMVEHTKMQAKLHEQAQDLNHLIQMQQAVNSISSTPELYQRIVEIVSFSFSAGAVCLMPYDTERSLLHVGAKTGIDDEVAKRLVFRQGEGRIGDCLSKQEVIFVRDVFSDPVLAQKLYGVNGIGSAVFTPLMLKDTCLGVLAVFFSGRPLRTQKLPKEHLRLLDALANQAALALDMHQLRNTVIHTVKATDDHARELEVVAEIGQAVTAHLDIHALVDTLSEKLCSVVGAKSCSVLVFDPDVIGVRIMGHRKLTRYNSISEHTDSCDLLAAMVAQDNEPKVINDAPNSCHCKYPEMAMSDGGTHHLLSVPMQLPGFLGAISVFRQNSEPFGEKEKRILTRLAPIVAIGIRNAELYEREKKIAENLQQSFLPELDHELPDIQVLSFYRAAFDESMVGGDFYDVTDFGDGKYGIVIGDVAGKGLDAAVYTAMTRYMIKAYSNDNNDPMYVISKLNNALCRYTPVGKFITLVYGVLDTKANQFTYINAGHELPFFRKHNDNKIDTLKSSGPAAGALLEAEYRIEKMPFKPGDTLVMYTDGASDARHEGKFLGTEGLHRIVANLTRIRQGDVDGLPEAIVNSILEYSNNHLRDDVAILVVKSRVPGALF